MRKWILVFLNNNIRFFFVIKEKFDYLYANENGKLIAVVVNNDGSTTETEVNPYKSPNQCLITDGKGDSLVIDKNGRPMGKGTSISESFNFRGLGLSFIQNFDGNNKFIGIGLGLDLKASGAVKLTKVKVKNSGIIVSAQEFEQLKKIPFKEADFKNKVFEVRNVGENGFGQLLIYGIPTGIKVKVKQGLYISNKAYLIYEK